MFKPASFLLPVDTSERVTLVPIFYFIKNQASAPPFLLSAKRSRLRRRYKDTSKGKNYTIIPVFAFNDGRLFYQCFPC